MLVDLNFNDQIYLIPWVGIAPKHSLMWRKLLQGLSAQSYYTEPMYTN